MIDFQNVSKTFGTQQVLRDASFRVSPGERVGIVGPNGAGKTTVFALICNECSPDAGLVNVPREMRTGYLHQQLTPGETNATLLEHAESGIPELLDLDREIHRLTHSLDAADGDTEPALRQLGDAQTRFETLGGYAVRHRAEIALTGLGFKDDDFHRPLASFSGGWQMRAELAKVTVASPELLLMDEPTNYLDTVAIEWLQRFLRDFPGTLLLISHDRYLLNSLTTTTIEIANGEATRYQGNYDVYARERVLRITQREAAHKKQERKRREAERFIDRFRAKNTKASQVQSKIKMLERMDEVEMIRPVVSPGHIRIPDPPRSGQQVITLSDAGFSYDQNRWVVRHVDLCIERGDKLALVGLNGTGKTTLLRILAGQLTPQEGVLRIGHNVTLGYQSQEFSDTLDARSTPLAAVKMASRDMNEQQVRTLLGGFGFSGDSVEKPISVLSGGEKIRLAFARLLADPPSLLILDEPTSHLDIPAREALEHALRTYTGTLCVVSHDVEFLRHVAETVIAMDPPGVARFAGGYDYYREKLAAAQGEPPPSNTPVVQKPLKYTKQRRRLQKDIRRSERTLETLEAERATITQKLADNPDSLDYAKTNRRLAELAERIDDTSTEWEQLAMQLEELDRGNTCA